MNMINPVFLSNRKNNIAFRSLEREVFEGKKIKYRNNTYFFRSDLNWSRVIDNITEGDIPKKIYCYACSDGSEPYSIAIGLISKLGWEKAQKYFPIIAGDIDEEMVNTAKKGELKLRKEDIIKIKRYEKKSGIKFLKKYYANGEDNFSFTGVLSDELKSCVDFKVRDICQEANDIDYKNSVIFFRNALPYLSKQNRDMLLATFARNLNDTTAIVVGAFDFRILGMPLFSVNNTTFGLIESPKYYFKGARKKDIPAVYIPYNYYSSLNNNYDKIIPKNFYFLSTNNYIKKPKQRYVDVRTREREEY